MQPKTTHIVTCKSIDNTGTRVYCVCMQNTDAGTVDAPYVVHAFTPRQFERLCVYKAAVKSGYYTDYLKGTCSLCSLPAIVAVGGWSACAAHTAQVQP